MTRRRPRLPAIPSDACLSLLLAASDITSCATRHLLFIWFYGNDL